MLVYASIGVLVLSFSMLAIELLSPGSLMSGVLYIGLFAIAAVVLGLYVLGRMSATVGVSIICTVNQFLISLSMILHALEATEHGVNVIIGDMVLAVSNYLLIIGSYIRRMPYVLASLILITYAICLLITRNGTIGMMLPIFFIPVITLSATGARLAKNVMLLEAEKDRLKEEEVQILNLFELDKTQLMACIKLAKEKGLSFEQTRQMLDSIGNRTKENIHDNVLRYARQSRIDYERLAQRFPELTPSEIAICRLILQDKKLKEICNELGKSESNITCQRSNIRSKLGLRREDDLVEALRNRVENGN